MVIECDVILTSFWGPLIWILPQSPNFEYPPLSASKHLLPILGTFVAQTTPAVKGNRLPILYNVTRISNLNLLNRNTIASLNISIKFCSSSTSMNVISLLSSSDEQTSQLQEACTKLCEDYGELFKPELGCLKNCELEVQFNPEAKPIFCKQSSVPFAIQI